MTIWFWLNAVASVANLVFFTVNDDPVNLLIGLLNGVCAIAIAQQEAA